MFELNLPSGLIIEATSLDGDGVIQIAERVGGNASGATIAALMRAATKRVVDPGPYPMLRPGEIVSNWASALWGDLLSAVIQLRIHSFPSHRGSFPFEFSCPHCRALVSAEIDLEDMLADPEHFGALPEESKEILINGQMFEFTLPTCGRKVKFDLARAEQDDPMRALMKQEKRKKETDVETIAKRLKEIEGVDNKTGPIRDMRSLWRWCKAPGNLVSNDIDALLDEMRRVDIVVNTSILAWCDNADKNCERQSRIQLPLDVSFFRPRSGTKRVATAKHAGSASSSPGLPANGGSASPAT